VAVVDQLVADPVEQLLVLWDLVIDRHSCFLPLLPCREVRRRPVATTCEAGERHRHQTPQSAFHYMAIR
jgi:hypothetical protein